ncbi:MAG: T9SS type A sorting domain-containing protein [Ignavibacteria bacterium]|nr:T9SS type A sorting domain-containing protein [Ignavibacteria bacterium]
MKGNLLKLLFTFVLMLCINYNGFAQADQPWKWVHPTPQGNTLRYVKTFNATTYYALGYAGTFIKTTNSGSNWFITHKVFGQQLDNQWFIYSGWFFDQNTGLACGESGKVSRTTNGGTSWDTISTGVTATLYGMHFINTTTGFMCTSTSGDILKTTNAGLNWTAISTGSSTSLYNIYAYDVNHIYATSSSANLRYTTNGGTNWLTVSTGSSSTLYDVCFKDVNTGWVCGTSTAIRVTTNGGTNWTQTSTGLPSTTFYELSYITSVNTLYASGNAIYAFKSTDNGSTWDSVQIAANQVYISTQYSLDRNGSSMVTGGAFGLINTSTNSGTNWVAHNYLGYAGTLNDVWCENMNGKVIAVGSVAPVPIIISSNGGMNWNFTASTNVTFTCYGIKMLTSNTGYVCGSTSMLAKTTNGGLNWDTTKIYPTSTTLYGIDFINTSTGWTSGSTGRIFKTTDSGANWVLQTSGVTNTLYSIDMFDANTGWFVGTTGSIRKTTDGGTTWTAQTPGTTSSLYDVQMFDANTGYLCGLSGNVRKTTNGGTDWDTVTVPYTSSLYALSFINVNTGFIAGSSGLTYRTSNGGSSWEVLNTAGSTTNGIYARGYDSAYAVASSAGVFKLHNLLVGGITWNNEIPESYRLEQNFPNPFNPVTTIKFAIPKTAKVTLKVYDILGREVDILFNDIEMNAGTVSYKYDASNLASGIYFYSLIANNNKIDTKKMVLVK